MPQKRQLQTRKIALKSYLAIFYAVERMATISDLVELGSVHQVKVDAKGAGDEGICKVGEFVLFIKNAKTRIGNSYKVKVTKVYRTFAYAELLDNKRGTLGNGGAIEFA
jgi:predicted RNA-binding protein with TRAM domain